MKVENAKHLSSNDYLYVVRSLLNYAVGFLLAWCFLTAHDDYPLHLMVGQVLFLAAVMAIRQCVAHAVARREGGAS